MIVVFLKVCCVTTHFEKVSDENFRGAKFPTRTSFE